MVRTLPVSTSPVSTSPARARRLTAVALTLCTLAAAAGCRPDETERTSGPERLPERSNVLLITVDTLRADHLGSYGSARDTSPNLDRLAAEGVRFAEPIVQWPKTGPSFASMFTSTYPKDNQIVRRIGQPLPCRFRMLAEELRDAGYQTHAVIANGALASDFYFDQGFDTYLEGWKIEPSEDGLDPIGAEQITRLAVGLLERIRTSDRPWFLWVHYVDPHFPYTPPGEWADRFQGDGLAATDRTIEVTDRPKQQMRGIGPDRVLDGRDDLAFYRARYDAEIAYNDHWIGELLAAAGERGLMERTLTVVTSDHGESLGEHEYYFDHGRFGFETCLRVPLILHYPGVLEPGVDPAPVELIHLAPTLLEAAGVELSEGTWMQGRTLTPRLRAAAGGSSAPPVAADEVAADEVAAAPPIAFSEAGWEAHNKWQKIARGERYKLIYAQTRPEQQWIGGTGVRFTLYDLREDPGETVNVAERHPEILEELQRELAAWERAERFPVAVEPAAAACGDQRTMEDETRKVLESLGYL